MTIELKVPKAGESITEVIIAAWFKKEGDAVETDEPMVEIDSDKASMEVGAPAAGVITKLLKGEGETVAPGDVIALIDENGAPAKSDAKKDTKKDTKKTPKKTGKQAKADAPEQRVMPAAKRAAHDKGVDVAEVTGSGPGGRVLKEDIESHTSSGEAESAKPGADIGGNGARETETVRMTLLRKRVAQRLVESQQTAAILTTFNEVDMSEVMRLRAQFKDGFEKKHGVKLGFMSFFVKAAVEALREMPQVNARIDGDNIVYHNYQDISVAVGGGRGLVVPVIRNAERLSFADIEKTISDFGKRAQDNKITPDEMAGGTFTISNGGIYGSLLSTPIINPPQSGILGMHAIQDRPVVRNGEIVIRPMMYLALSYDHRLVDGREAVTFLIRIKDCLENPTRILMEV